MSRTLHFVQRQAATGSAYIGPYTDKKGDTHGPFHIIGDYPYPVASKEVGQYVASRADNLQYYNQTEDEAEDTMEQFAGYRGDRGITPGDETLVVDADTGDVNPTAVDAARRSRGLTSAATPQRPPVKR